MFTHTALELEGSEETAAMFTDVTKDLVQFLGSPLCVPPTPREGRTGAELGLRAHSCLAAPAPALAQAGRGRKTSLTEVSQGIPSPETGPKARNESAGVKRTLALGSRGPRFKSQLSHF